MAATHPIPALPAQPPPGAANLTESAGADRTVDASRTRALVRAESPAKQEAESSFHPLVLRLPVEVEVSVPVREFRVCHLLALAPGQVIESRWSNGIDLPLAAGDVQLAWTEFEVVETRLAVRVTRVA
jgi:flagellar motor switch/type III secretory pathway protein FliN